MDPTPNGKEYLKFEYLFLRLNLIRYSPIIGVIYRPPGQCLTEFLGEFEQLMGNLNTKSKDIFPLGDYNIDLLKVIEHKETSLLHNNLISHQYLPVITRPTRITPYTKTLLDNIFCTAWSKLQVATIILSDLSDHLPVLAQFSYNSKLPMETKYLENRTITQEGIEKFSQSLINDNWNLVHQHCQHGRVDDAYGSFILNYTKAYTGAFPLKVDTRRKKAKNNKPWMTLGLLKSCRKKISYILIT